MERLMQPKSRLELHEQFDQGYVVPVSEREIDHDNWTFTQQLIGVALN